MIRAVGEDRDVESMKAVEIFVFFSCEICVRDFLLCGDVTGILIDARSCSVFNCDFFFCVAGESRDIALPSSLLCHVSLSSELL